MMSGFRAGDITEGQIRTVILNAADDSVLEDRTFDVSLVGEGRDNRYTIAGGLSLWKEWR